MTNPTPLPLRLTLALTLLALAAACGGTGGEDRDPDETPPPPDPVVVAVSIEPSEVTLDVGETYALAALVTTEVTEPAAVAEEPVVSWESQATGTVTVSPDGTLEALAPGVATVTATAGGITAEAVITVRETAPPPPPPPPVGVVVSVELSEGEVSLAEGARHALTATPRDADGAAVGGLAVTWRTSDEGVVYVTAGGELRAVRTGAADVTATVHGKVATARVNVTLETPYDLFFEAWSDARQRFVYYTRDVRDSQAEPTALMDGGFRQGHPTPRPQGDRLALANSVPGTGSGQLRIVNLHRETLLAIDFPGHVTDPAWSPDGEWLAFSLWSAETGADLWVIRADGQLARNLTATLGVSGETQPTWSPAALGRIAFTRTADGLTNLWTVNVDGTDPRQLTTGVADADPAWSPDGSTIAFQRSDVATFGDLWFVSPQGALQRSLGQLPGIQARPTWSPDGELLAFVSGGDVYTVRRDGGFVARRTFDGDLRLEARPGWLLRR